MEVVEDLELGRGQGVALGMVLGLAPVLDLVAKMLIGGRRRGIA